MPVTPHFNSAHMLSFDLETTGTNPFEAKIVTSALVTINGRQRDEVELLADPGIEIPKEASDVHGITTEYAREHGRPHDEVLRETIQRIRDGWADGATLIVYNAAYDLTILRVLDPTFSVDGLVLDPYVVDRAKNRFRKGKRTLESVCAAYNIELSKAHEATADSVAAARVAWKLGREYPELGTMSADELMLAQARWHYEAQSSLQKYFDDKSKDVRVDTEWPLRPR